jgi:hypothetical protein
MSTRRPTRITGNRPSLIAAWMVRSDSPHCSAAVFTEKQIAIKSPSGFLRLIAPSTITLALVTRMT